MEAQTEVKVDKRTKEYKAKSVDSSQSIMEKIEALIAIGIPLERAVFHSDILSYGANRAGIPETGLFAPPTKSGKVHTTKASKTANIWFTPNVVIIEQNGRFKLIPSANLKDSDVLL